jgi:alpha-beta hydrolase superfamily lysophospholipase
MTVLDLFQANFGKPRRIIQFGCSGGGNTALSIAERYPDRVDGAIATNAYTAIQAANVWLDLLYTLRALLAPGSDLPVTAPADVNAAITAWRVVLDAAQQTPEGRARIALAIALAQYPTWTQVGTSEPDVHDVIALSERCTTRRATRSRSF